MTRGYPDFFGFSVFPYYGSNQVVDEYAGVAIADGNSDDLAECGSKGRSLGGWLAIAATAWSLRTITLQPIIDTVSFPAVYIYDYRQWGLGTQLNDVLQLTYYKPVSGYFFAFAIKDGINWGQSFKIRVEQNTGNNIAVYAMHYWQQVV